MEHKRLTPRHFVYYIFQIFFYSVVSKGSLFDFRYGQIFEKIITIFNFQILKLKKILCCLKKFEAQIFLTVNNWDHFGQKVIIFSCVVLKKRLSIGFSKKLTPTNLRNECHEDNWVGHWENVEIARVNLLFAKTSFLSFNSSCKNYLSFRLVGFSLETYIGKKHSYSVGLLGQYWHRDSYYAIRNWPNSHSLRTINTFLAVDIFIFNHLHRVKKY